MATEQSQQIIAGAVATLVETLSYDALMNWWLRPGGARLAAAQVWFQQEIKICQEMGGAVLTLGDGEAVAILFPPPNQIVNSSSSIWVSLKTDIKSAGILRLWRLWYLRIVLGRYYQGTNCAQLRYIAVSSAHQGRGLGKQLLSRIGHHCARNDWNCVLETTSPDAKLFFTGLGWQEICEKRLPFARSFQISFLKLSVEPSSI